MGIKIENVSGDPDDAHFRGGFVIRKLGLDIVYLCAKFDDSSFSIYIYTVLIFAVLKLWLTTKKN